MQERTGGEEVRKSGGKASSGSFILFKYRLSFRPPEGSADEMVNILCKDIYQALTGVFEDSFGGPFQKRGPLS